MLLASCDPRQKDRAPLELVLRAEQVPLSRDSTTCRMFWWQVWLDANSPKIPLFVLQSSEPHLRKSSCMEDSCNSRSKVMITKTGHSDHVNVGA